MKLATEHIRFETEIHVGESKAKVTLVSLSKDETQTMLKRHTKNKFVKGQKTEEVDYFGFAQDRFERILEAWDGITDTQGNPMPCDQATKRLVYQHNPDFVTAVIEAADEYANRAEALAEGARGN